MVSPRVTPTTSTIIRTVAMTFRWLSTTPRGAEVLPEVYWRKQTSSSVARTWVGRGVPASSTSGVR